MDKDREAFDVAAHAREEWNARADRFNQWADLGGDERESFIAMFSAGWQAALAYVRAEGEREGWKTGLEEVGTTDRGYTIYRQVNEVGGHRYWSDEIGGGVVAWDTCLVDAGTLHECLRIEKRAHALSELAAADGELLSPATAEDVRRASERQAEVDSERPSALAMVRDLAWRERGPSLAEAAHKASAKSPPEEKE